LAFEIKLTYYICHISISTDMNSSGRIRCGSVGPWGLTVFGELCSTVDSIQF
jgi:hypothetical protein